ncbi:hypothetical protein T05_9159 [Trichinella murrelli]|uniref:Uncharacterized protein n=1 Tax=Trichinella murrelli TaxID=144512 RepID=A0A0V0THR9_9BILA|nr:hypothetical protein T05_9159 [Trichinella murrelli]
MTSSSGSDRSGDGGGGGGGGNSCDVHEKSINLRNPFKVIPSGSAGQRTEQHAITGVGRSSVHLKTIINKSMENKELKKVQQRSVDCSSVCYWCNQHVQQVAYQLAVFTDKQEEVTKLIKLGLKNQSGQHGSTAYP